MGQALSWGRSLPSPAWTLVTPLLQAHLTWARDEHEGRGTSTSLTLDSGHLATPPLTLAHALDPSGLGHAAHSLVGLGTPLSRNADTCSDYCARRRALFAHCSFADDRWREVAVAPLAHRTVRCYTGQYGEL
jgi:hypothetical protein